MRAALESDRPFLEALYVEKRRAEVSAWGLSPEQQAAFLSSQYAAFRHSLKGRPALREFVLTQAESACGYLAVDEVSGELRVVELQVLLAFRRRGIARRALEAVLEEADARRLHVSLHVDHGNPAARLYEALGFATIETDALGLSMRRPLS